MAIVWKRKSKQVWMLSALITGIIMDTKLVDSLKPNTGRSELIEYVNEDTAVADGLLVGYDKRFIPAKPGTPLQVRLQVVVSNVLRIGKMEAEMIIFIRQSWYDYRLALNRTRRLKIREHFLDKIWLPDVRIINLKETKRFDGFGGVNMNIYPDGRVYYSQLVHVMTSCPMDLHRFPMDKQICFLNFSSFAYATSLMKFTPAENKAEVRRHKLPQFELVELNEIEEKVSAGGVSKLTIALTFQRRAGYYVLQVYIPASFLVILSWLSFFMEASNIADRLALEITMILSTVFLLGGINDSVTHVSYAKASDWFVIVSFGFIFVALLETMLVYRLSTLEEKRIKPAGSMSPRDKQLSIIFLKTDEEEAQGIEDKLKQPAECDSPAFRVRNKVKINNNTKETSSKCWIKSCKASLLIDKCCLVLFPMLYIAFNLGYWFYYLHG